MKEILRYLRHSRNLTQAEAAQLAGVSRQSYIKYEGGSVVPSDAVVRGIAQAFGVEPAVLYRNEVPGLDAKPVGYHIDPDKGHLEVASPAFAGHKTYEAYFDGTAVRVINPDDFAEGQRFTLIAETAEEAQARRARAWEVLLSFEGSVSVPKDFDYKEALYEALEEKYGPID